MKNLLAGILILFFFISCADRSGKDLLSPGDMKEDIRYLFHMIRDIHPDPYQRYDSMAFVALEKKMIESCSVPMAREDFGWRLMKVRKFLDGHATVLVGEKAGQYYPICLRKDIYNRISLIL